MAIIRKLDKHTLNMYTPFRAGLGTQGLSWIRLDFSEMPGEQDSRRCQEEWQQ
jgi:hypothetical protein